jgi:4-hydroxy-tetrahydrodipicolinate synthase
MKQFVVKGSWPGLVTPFTKRGDVNTDSLSRLVEFHKENESDGLLLLGSTGEAMMLKMDERKRVIDTVVDAANGQIPIMCGTSAVTTDETIENTRYAKNAGVDCALIVQPPYIKPTQKSLFFYFKEVAESVDFPIAIYNNPDRTGVNIEAETIARLSHIPNIVALKEAGPNSYQIVRVIELAKGRMSILCCDCPFFALILTTLAAGGHGTTSVTGALSPREFARISTRWDTFQDVEKTRELYLRFLPLMRLIYAEPNPVPLKAALNVIGADVGTPRKPLMKLEAHHTAMLKITLERLEILQDGSYQREFFGKK